MSRVDTTTAQMLRVVNDVRRDQARARRRHQRAEFHAGFRRGFRLAIKWAVTLTLTGMIATASTLLAYRMILAPFTQ